ncbi:hypothetical protein EVAR_83056_1 [Eumeta japonica]|uniref:Mariner Mos1 transposase n=1 Tax=Eumeta variegata TaxID=151549 RepID=A0A4C1VP28_EUMVA|nr:hypothetical protein EVAR_83056_1 [Eumeta japonica]
MPTSYNRLRLIFHDKTPFLAIVYQWFDEFKRDRTNLTDDRLTEGHHSTTTTTENISAVPLITEIDKRITYQQIRSNFDIGIRRQLLELSPLPGFHDVRFCTTCNYRWPEIPTMSLV